MFDKRGASGKHQNDIRIGWRKISMVRKTGHWEFLSAKN